MTHLNLKQNLKSKDEFFFLKKMTNQMYKKLQKYWVDFYTILAISIFLDPRYKMEFMKLVFDRLYGIGSSELGDVKSKLFTLFYE